MTSSDNLTNLKKTVKAVLRFEKSKEASVYTNDAIIALFKQTFPSVPELSISNRLSLASSNQTKGIIAGVDYLFFDIEKQSLMDSAGLVLAINVALNDKLHITDLVSLGSLSSMQINKYAYYIADLSQLSLPENFHENITILVTRDTDRNGEYISVTESTYRMKGNRQKLVPKNYHLLELIPHVHYVSEESSLYFIADGNAPAFVLLAGLLYGKCNFTEEFLPHVTLSRLDYLDDRQKIQHSLNFYDNVLGDYISLC